MGEGCMWFQLTPQYLRVHCVQGCSSYAVPAIDVLKFSDLANVMTWGRTVGDIYLG